VETRHDSILLSTFEFETVTLDERGDVKERRKGQARQFLEELAPNVTLAMVEISGGKFTMGSSESESRRLGAEGPQHEVTVPPFYIGKFAVTQAEWRAVAGWDTVEGNLDLDHSRFKGDDRPVDNVDWEVAEEFCAILAKRTGRLYRLPSEAEWEYACRAGTTTPFAFGETITPEIVNYNGDYPYAKAEKGRYRIETVPVGSLGAPNAFGLFDLHGNVWEWCEDVWHNNYDSAPTNGSAWLSGGDSIYRALRGGSSNTAARDCRSAFRRYEDMGDSSIINVGFRVVVSARTL
jgi:formylglycine-generating enzyme required for sulfatase activity